MKRYITYTRVKANDNYYLDPNTNKSFENATENSKFYETPYEHNGIFIAYVEYPDNTPQKVIDGLLQAYSAFHFTFITEEEANTLLKKIDELISVQDFIFTDNRVFDDLI